MELQSAEIDQIAAAMVKMQGALQPARKDAINPFFKSGYADLEMVYESFRKPMSDNNLAITHQQVTIEGQAYLVCSLIHTSGQWLRGYYEFKPPSDKAQEFGSYMTYLKRYSASAMVTVVTSDDDGELAMRRGKADAKPKAAKIKKLPEHFSREYPFWLELDGYEKCKDMPFSELPDSLLQFLADNKDAKGLDASKKKAAKWADEELGCRIEEQS